VSELCATAARRCFILLQTSNAAALSRNASTQKGERNTPSCEIAWLQLLRQSSREECNFSRSALVSSRGEQILLGYVDVHDPQGSRQPVFPFGNFPIPKRRYTMHSRTQASQESGNQPIGNAANGLPTLSGVAGSNHTHGT